MRLVETEFGEWGGLQKSPWVITLAGTWWGPLGSHMKALSESLGEFPWDQAADPCLLHGHRD